MDMLWSDPHGEWALTNEEIHGFLRMGTEWMSAALERLYDEIGARPSDGEDGEWIDIFERETHGVGMGQFPRLTMAAALREGVTAFEVYLEKAREHVLNQVGLTATHKTDAHTPRWHELRTFFKLFGLDIETRDVQDVRDRRHILTHKRGQLRRDEDRRLSHHGEDPGVFVREDELNLTAAGVREDLRVLADMVRAVEAALVAKLSDRENGPSWLLNELALWSLEEVGFKTTD